MTRVCWKQQALFLFSKSYFPTLRSKIGVIEGMLREEILQIRMLSDWQSMGVQFKGIHFLDYQTWAREFKSHRDSRFRKARKQSSHVASCDFESNVAILSSLRYLRRDAA